MSLSCRPPAGVSLLDCNRVVVDHGIREEAAAYLLDFLAGGSSIFRLQVDQEQFRAADALNAFESEEMEGLLNVVAFGIRDALFQPNLDADLDHRDSVDAATASSS